MLAHVCELTWGSAQNPQLTPLRGRFCLLVQYRGPLRPYGRNVNTQTCGKGVTGDPSAYTATLFSGRAGILQSNAETFRVVRHREVTVTGGHFPRFCDCSYLFPHSYRVQRFMFRSTDLQPFQEVRSLRHQHSSRFQNSDARNAPKYVPLHYEPIHPVMRPDGPE